MPRHRLGTADAYEVEAAPLLEELAAVRTFQTYCRWSEGVKRAAPWRSASPAPTDGGTPALDARERDVLRRLADMRARFEIVVH